MNTGVTLTRPSHPDHARQMAILHAEGITEGFLSTLGPGFLAALYEGIAAAPRSGVFVALEGDTVLGFISYTRDVKACYRDVLRRRWPRLMGSLLPNLLRASIYRKILETLLYPLRHKGAHQAEGSAQDQALGVLRPELLSMAVSPHARGKGVGKMLVARLDQQMKEMGVDGYFVVTHGTDERSNGFYQTCGFTRARAYTSHGKPMHEYHKSL